jgi:phosphoenolpyruvate carboxykinase (ATP)
MNPPDTLRKHLADLGFNKTETLYYNLSPARLYEIALRRGEGRLAAHGPLVTRTDPHTGRSPKDRFVVKESETQDSVAWGKVNVPISEEVFDRLLRKMGNYASGRDLFVRDCFAGADERYRLPVRIVTEHAWHSVFAYNMFLRPRAEELDGFDPGFTVINLPGFKGVNEAALNSSTFIIMHLARRMVIIGGTQYAGETKKSVFSALNYLLPEQNVFPMHCSANVGYESEEDVAVFFGLSGTGKTTLSADPERILIGDDEHGWSDRGIFNFEGGCYAKAIKLRPDTEPEIYGTTLEFGTIAENVILDEDREIDFDDATITENTRLSYPLDLIPNASAHGVAGHPRNVIFLTADAFGVLPPIAKLTPAQAMYHFLSGYTAKVAGTERGITEPVATFSACFGEPFMIRPPTVYAEMLGDKLREHDAQCFLVNTGWTGGPYGVGERMKLSYTRTMLRAALAGELDDADTFTEPFFGLEIPRRVQGVPAEILDPRETWGDPDAYDEKAREVADMFANNFERYAEGASQEIVAAGPSRAETV